MRSIVQSRTTLGTDDQDAIRWLYGDGGNSCTSSGPPTVSAIAQNSELTGFAFESGCQLRVKIIPPGAQTTGHKPEPRTR